MRFNVAELRDQTDRTLLLAIDQPTVLFHTWLAGGKVHRARLNLRSGTIYNQFSGVEMSYLLLISEGTTYPESTDFEFARLLRAHRFASTYSDFQFDNGEKRLAKFGPFHAPTTPDQAAGLDSVEWLYR